MHIRRFTRDSFLTTTTTTTLASANASATATASATSTATVTDAPQIMLLNTDWAAAGARTSEAVFDFKLRRLSCCDSVRSVRTLASKQSRLDTACPTVQGSVAHIQNRTNSTWFSQPRFVLSFPE